MNTNTYQSPDDTYEPPSTLRRCLNWLAYQLMLLILLMLVAPFIMVLIRKIKGTDNGRAGEMLMIFYFWIPFGIILYSYQWINQTWHRWVDVPSWATDRSDLWEIPAEDLLKNGVSYGSPSLTISAYRLDCWGDKPWEEQEKKGATREVTLQFCPITSSNNRGMCKHSKWIIVETSTKGYVRYITCARIKKCRMGDPEWNTGWELFKWYYDKINYDHTLDDLGHQWRTSKEDFKRVGSISD